MTKTRGKRRKGGEKKTRKHRKPSNVEFIEVSSFSTPEEVEKIPKIIQIKKSKKLKPLLVLEDVSTPKLSSPVDIKELSLVSDTSHAQLVAQFIQMLNTVKLYHWKTSSYAEHKATDELYSNLNSTIDKYVEIMLGKTGGRVNLTGTKTIPLLDYSDVSDFKREIEMYKNYLIDLQVDGKKDTDLLNVRDEILGHLNQFTYLLTFK